METIDIVVTTYNRPGYLGKTLYHLLSRTTSSYHLWIADDGSTESNLEYIEELWKVGHVYGVMKRRDRLGVRSLLNWASWATFSDPVVFVDDDMICPDVEPDWLNRGTTAMERHPELAMLALRHPGAKTKSQGQSGEVTYCLSLGGTFLFIRREFLMANPLPHELGDLGRPLELRCKMAHEGGWKIGYLTNTYCYHIGKMSAIDGKPYKGEFIPPVDWKTLEPSY